MWNTPVNSNRSNWLGAQRFRANTLQSTLNLLLRRPNFQDFHLPPRGRGSTFCRTSFRGRCTPHTWRRLPSGTSSPCTSQIRLRSKANSMTCKEDSNEQPRLTASGHNRAGHHVGLGVLHGGQQYLRAWKQATKTGGDQEIIKASRPMYWRRSFSDPMTWAPSASRPRTSPPAPEPATMTVSPGVRYVTSIEFCYGMPLSLAVSAHSACQEDQPPWNQPQSLHCWGEHTRCSVSWWNFRWQSRHSAHREGINNICFVKEILLILSYVILKRNIFNSFDRIYILAFFVHIITVCL